MNWLISYSRFICAVFSLKNSASSWNINVIAILWVSTYYEFLWTMWTFHTELIYFGSMKIPYPCFNRVESNSLSYHVLTALTSHMEWCLISYFTASNSFSFDNLEWLIFCEFTLLRWYFIRVVVFRVVEIICSGCCKCTHLEKYYNKLVLAIIK